MNGKPVNSFSKTKETPIDIIDNSDKSNYIQNEKSYQLISDALKAELKELLDQGKTMSFKYVNAGFKIHRAVLELWNDKIIMRCYRGDLTKVDLDESKLEEVSTTDEGVEQMDLSSLEV